MVLIPERQGGKPHPEEVRKHRLEGGGVSGVHWGILRDRPAAFLRMRSML
jgi:hypothetical protein